MRALFLTMALVACGGGSDDSGAGGGGCDACADGEICLVYFEESGDTREECAALTPNCSGDDSCECRGEMYGQCEDPFVGVSCSDTSPPTIISCNP